MRNRYGVRQRTNTVRNTLISVVVLLLVMVGGGVGYTYFLGPDGTQIEDTAAAVQAVAPQATIKPTQQAPDARVGVSVQTIASPVAPGANTSIAIKTNQLAKCKILVKYNEVVAKDSGLADKTADEFGTVSWTWTVAASAPLGKWPVDVTCTNQKGDKSGVVRADLVVAKPVE